LNEKYDDQFSAGDNMSGSGISCRVGSCHHSISLIFPMLQDSEKF